MDRFLRSVTHAWRGVSQAARQERNFQIELAVAVLVLCSGYFLGFARWEWLLVFLCIGGVLASELFNSALERLADVVAETEDERIGLLKDMAAGAVLLAASTTVIVGVLIVLPRMGLGPI